MFYRPNQVVVERLGNTITLLYCGKVPPTDRSLESFRRKLGRCDISQDKIKLRPSTENMRLVPLLRFELSPHLSYEQGNQQVREFVDTNTRVLVTDKRHAVLNPRSARSRTSSRRDRDHERPLPRLLHQPAGAARAN
jgi:hypothetical protein